MFSKKWTFKKATVIRNFSTKNHRDAIYRPCIVITFPSFKYGCKKVIEDRCAKRTTRRSIC